MVPAAKNQGDKGDFTTQAALTSPFVLQSQNVQNLQAIWTSTEKIIPKNMISALATVIKGRTKVTLQLLR